MINPIVAAILQIAAVVIVLGHIFNWVRNYVSSQKELSAIDSEARSALKETIDAQKEFIHLKDRILDETKTAYEKEIAGMTGTHQKLGDHLKTHERFHELVDYISGFTLRMAKTRSRNILGIVRKVQSRLMISAVELMTAEGIQVDQKKINELLDGATQNPHRKYAHAGEQLFHDIIILYAAVIRTTFAFRLGTTLVPTSIKILNDHPDASLQNIFDTWHKESKSIAEDESEWGPASL